MIIVHPEPAIMPIWIISTIVVVIVIIVTSIRTIDRIAKWRRTALRIALRRVIWNSRNVGKIGNVVNVIGHFG
jgi:hypothetical protein